MPSSTRIMLPLPTSLMLLFTATSLIAQIAVNAADQQQQQHFIFFHFQGDIEPPVAECVQKAMLQISKSSCATFKRTVSEQNEGNGEMLQFVMSNDARRCDWERRTTGNGSSTVSLGSLCGTELITCTRIIMRALGIKPHEQIIDTNSVLYEADDANAHSFNALHEQSQRQTQRSSSNLLSHRDKHVLDKHFNCTDVKNNEYEGGTENDISHKAHCKPMKCTHGGRLASNCKCTCTYGFTGNQCEKLAKSSIFNGPTCGVRKTTEPGTITSPGFPQKYPTGTFCQWLIEAPHPWQKIAFRVESLDLDYDEALPTQDCPDMLHIFAYGTDLVTKPLPCKTEDVFKYVAREFETQQNWLLVEWRSNIWNSEHDHRGFNISYRVVGEQPLQNDEKEKVVSDANEGLKALLAPDAAQLQCYSCEREACNSTKKESWTNKTCPKKHACSQSKYGASEVSWRGCMSVDDCMKNSNSCSTENAKYPCTICCADTLCNSASSMWQSLLLVVHTLLLVILLL